MAKSKKTGQTQKSDVSVSPKDLLQEIAKNHLQKELGEISDYKSGRYKYWDANGKLLKHHVFTDAASKTFIYTPSEQMIRSVQNDNATFIGIHYYGGWGNIFTIYFFKPELIIKHYINAGIEPRNGVDTWHVTIGNDDENLILTRTGADDVIVPIDADNYYMDFEMDDEEYEQLLAILPEKKRSMAQIQTTLKVKVKGEQGEEEFSITSAIVIATLSILAKT